MTAKFDAFKAELIDLCWKHGVDLGLEGSPGDVQVVTASNIHAVTKYDDRTTPISDLGPIVDLTTGD